MRRLDSQAASGDQQVTLRWTAYTPAADVTGYEYSYKSTAGYGDWISVSGGQSTITVTVTGLTNGTEYTFQLRAVNHKGNGPATSDTPEGVKATPLPALPLQPTGFMAKAGVEKVTLTWDDPDNDTITGYEYRQKTVNTWAAWTDIPNSDKDTTTFERTGLTNDTLYAFKIRTTNLAGDGPESGEVTATPRALPAKPAGLTATGNNEQVALSWNNPNNSSIEKWQYSKDDGTTWADVPNSVASTTTYAVQNLTNNTTYTFRVRAVNVSGESPQSDAVTGTPVAGKPEAPTLTATGGDAQVALSWSKGGDTHVTSWEYQYKTTGSYGDWTAVPSSSDSTTSYTVLSLDNGNTYTFKLRGKNDFGDGLGAVSSEVSAPTLPLKPAGFTAAAKTGRTPIALFAEGQVDLTWTDPDNDAITDWQYQYKSKPAGGSYGSYGDWTSVTPAASGNDLTHTVAGLTNGTSYTFKIRAVNAAGNSPASNESGEATPTQPTPAKPAGFAATPMNASADLAWTDPGNSSITKWQMRHWTGSAADFVVGSGATGQEIALSWSASSTANITKWQYSTDGSTWTDICATSGNADCPATTARDITTSTALTEDQQYIYQVRAEVSTGTAPTVSNLQAWATISATASTAKHTAAGLTNATAYKFQIRAVNPAGAGEASDEATATPRNIPAAPSNLTATPSKTGAASATLKWDTHDDPTVNKWQLRRRAEGASADFIVGTGQAQEITLEWTADANMGAPFDRWIFRHRVLQSPPKGPWSWNYISQNSNQTSHTFITKLTNGRRYEYEVFARLKTGNIYTPSNLKKWTKITPTTPDTNKLGYVADGLIHNTRYSLILRAANPIGNGMTETATARPVAGVPGQPATISATAGNDAQTTLTWTKNADGRWVDSWQYRKKERDANWPATGDKGWTNIADSNDATRSTTVGSLTNNQTYHFQVRGVNVAGNGTESTTIFAKPLAKPTKPAGFSATGGDREINLKWTATSDTSTTGYRYQYKLWRVGDDGLSAEPGSAQAILSWDNPSDSAITKWQYRKKKSAANWPTTGTNGWMDISGSGATTITYIVTGLINGTEYDFEVRAFTTSAQDALDGAQATPSVNEGWTSVSGSDADTASHTVKGLTNGQRYRAKVRALNHAKPNGVGPESDDDNGYTVPAKPANFMAAGGSAQTTLTWTDPNNSTITKWQARQRANGAGQSDFVVGSGATGQEITLEWSASSAANITKWQYSNDNGSTWTDICDTSSDPACPATTAHTITTSTELTDGTHYIYQVKATVSTGTAPTATNLKAWETVSTDDDATSHTVTDLVNGVTYRFQLRAANPAGAGDPSDETTSTTRPAKPANLKAEPGNALVVLVWDDPKDTSITKYQYQQKTTGDWGNDWTDITDSGASTVSHTIKSLTNATAYTFRIRAVNATGTGAASDEATATPSANLPSQPAGLTASISGTTATLSWDQTADTNVSKWQSRQKAGSGAWDAWTDIPSSNANTDSLTVTGLNAGTIYYFRVRIVNTSDAAGPGSEVASAATTPLKPTGLAASAGYRQASLSWDDPRYPSITKWQYLQSEIGEGGLTAVPGNAQVALSWTNPNDSTITKWQYRKKESGQNYGVWTDIPNSSAATTTYTVTGLTNGTAYAFGVRAFKTSAQTALDEVSATPTLDGGWADMSPSDAATRTFNVMSLASAKTYGFKIRAVNPAGSGPPSDKATATLPAAPDEAQDLTASKEYKPATGQTIEHFMITLNWKVSDPVDPTITGWQYRFALAGGNLNAAAWLDIPSSDKDTRSYAIPVGLTGAGYQFQVRATNISGGGAASNAAIVTLTPAAPTLSDIADADVKYDLTDRSFDVTLRWTAASPADPSIKRWQFRLASGDPDTSESEWTTKLSAAPWKDVTNSDKDTANHTLAGLDEPVYRFQLRAFNLAGPGAASNTEGVTLLPDAPENFTGKLSETSSREATLTWDLPEYAESITKYQYRLIEGDLAAIAGENQVTLRWKAPSDTSDITKWQYRQKPKDENDTGYSGWTDICIYDANDDTDCREKTSHTITGLNNATQYAFQVRYVSPSVLTPLRAGGQLDARQRRSQQPIRTDLGRPQQRRNRQVAVPQERERTELRRMDGYRRVPPRRRP